MRIYATHTRLFLSLLLLACLAWCAASRTAIVSAGASLFGKHAPLSTTITVDTTADTVAVDGKCSLREAIEAANTDMQVNECPAGSGADVIQFNLGTGTPTINLTGTTLAIFGDVVIDGGTGGATRVELNGAGAVATDGLRLQGSNNTIRSLVINRFSGNGITIQGGSNDVIENCFIGLNAAGTAALPNANGIALLDTDSDRIGGTTATQRNIISGNSGAGILFSAGVNILVQGNFIGTNAAGTAAIPNQIGINTDGFGMSDCTIGGTASGAGNLIAGNTQQGIVVLALAGNRILQNSIYSNGGLGIDLDGDGVTANDANDPDQGPNNLQNFPVINSITNSGTLSGSLDSDPAMGSSYPVRIEFFANSACDASGNGEGETFLGFIDLAAPGNFTFNFTPTPGKTIITATATDNNGNTSEFSACKMVTNSAPTITGQTISRQQGSPVSNSQIATVSDADQAPNTLTVTATPATGTGVTVTNIAISSAGIVTADVVASCTATNSTFTLTVTDNLGATATATLTVNVTTNPSPTLGTYPNTGPIVPGAGTTVTPSAAPTDNGTITSLTASALGFTGTFTGNTSTGVITISNAGPAGSYTVTVTATDNCAASSTRTFNLLVNTSPTITGQTISRQQGNPASNSQIATVSDADQAPNTLMVTATPATGAGVTVSNIAINNTGVVTADVAASCTATNSTFTLTVTDNLGATATATLTVNVTANSPPVLGTYPNTGPIAVGAGTTVTPSAAPTDNGTTTSLTASAPGFAGSFSGNTSTGVITISNASPAGNYTVTATATDNCAATSTRTFNLLVNTPPTITGQTISRQRGSAAINSQIATVSDPDQAPNTLTVTATPATGTGVTVNNIAINNAGVVTADVAASCAATNSTFTLTATDNLGSTGTATLTVNVTANTPPTLSYNSPQTVASGGSLTVNPATGPSDNGSVTSIALLSAGTYTGTVTVNAATGAMSFSNAQPAGSHTITIRATDNCNATTDASFTLNVTNQTADLALTMTGAPASARPDTSVIYTLRVTNNGPGNSPNTVLNDALPAPFTVENITTTQGTCTGLGTSAVNCNLGTLNAGATATVTIQAHVPETCQPATAVNNASVSGGLPDPMPANNSAQVPTNVDLASAGPGACIPANSPISDSKPGSILFAGLFVSGATAGSGGGDSNQNNTRVSLTNTHPRLGVVVHLFFVDGATCSVADAFVCITANQTASFFMSDLDPGTIGYMMMIAVDGPPGFAGGNNTGCPISFNYLIGSAFIKFRNSPRRDLNLATESCASEFGSPVPTCDPTKPTATLVFDGSPQGFNQLPYVLALDNIPSRLDGNDTLLMFARVDGNWATGLEPIGPLFGILYDDTEHAYSFNFNVATCLFRSSLSNAFPRTAPRFDQLLSAGRSGWMKIWPLNEVAIVGAMHNRNDNSQISPNAFEGGHTLHVLRLLPRAVITVPVFPPNC